MLAIEKCWLPSITVPFPRTQTRDYRPRSRKLQLYRDQSLTKLLIDQSRIKICYVASMMI
ncbi:MAG: hypothetical protein CMK72_06110 [Pseudomonadaceae bacterium]|nr:hypothetical protein [Pseudomonadaceae bacterium]